MSLGHGQLGLSDGLPTFSDLADDSSGSRRPYLDAAFGVEIVDWAVYSGSIFKTVVMLVYDYILRDIVGVDSTVGKLTRVESIGEMTVGTFYANIDTALIAPEYWDDGNSWDFGVGNWDTYTTAEYPPLEIYVWLPGGADPRTVNVVALLGFFFGTKGEVLPYLGPDKLQNGDYESLTGWTEDVAGAGWSSALDTAVKKSGASSLKLASTGAATGDVSRRQDRTTIAGKPYRYCAYYRTDDAFSANLTARLLISDGGTNVLYSDGRDGDASGQVVLRPTYGEWRAFFFDFLASGATTRIRPQLRAASSAGAGQLNIDRSRLKRIHRWVYYEPRLPDGAFSDLEVASQSLAFKGKTIQIGGITIINGDGRFEPILSQLLLHNKPATVWVGGTTAAGQEIHRDDWRAQFSALTQKPDGDDSLIRFEADDARNAAHVQLPPKQASLADYPAMTLNDEGSSIPLVFAPDGAIRWKPLRVRKTANGYGVYLLADAAGSLAGLLASGHGLSVKAYASEDLAQKDLGGTTATSKCSYDPVTGELTVNDDIRPYLNTLPTAGATAYYDQQYFEVEVTCTLGHTVFPVLFPLGSVPGDSPYTAEQLADAIELAGQLAQHNQGGLHDIMPDFTCTFSHATKTFTFTRTTGVLKLKCQSSIYGKNYTVLGFDVSADKTGALTYTAENPTFNDVDAQHIVRVGVAGFRDDPSGSITGTANGVVYKHCDVARYVLRQYLRTPASLIDAASFDAGRAFEASGGVRAIVQDRISSAEFLARLELGALADLIVDGEGVWRWKPYQDGAAPVQDFFDRDYLQGPTKFRTFKDPSKIFKALRLRYAENPARGSSKSYEYVADGAVFVKHGRVETRQEEAYLDGEVAGIGELLAQRLARLYAADPWWVAFSARGKLVDLLIGDIIRLTRARAFYPGGSMNNVRFRVFALTRNPISGIGTCVAVEDIAFV